MSSVLEFQLNGNLEPGIYELSWKEFCEAFGFSERRLMLMGLMKNALKELASVNCRTVYADGSFVNKYEQVPGDYDLCWDECGVSVDHIRAKCPGIIDYGFKMKRMKERYQGSIVPMTTYALENGLSYFHFFQEDRYGRPKGIIKINLKTLNDDQE